jgi:membrane protease YdiL (CAAX protease family)
LTQWIPVLFSVLFSSLLFGVVHGAYGFMTAFLAGIALCLSFFRGGLESVILAHFLADFLFFNWTYL